jgi:hypothetical protein
MCCGANSSVHRKKTPGLAHALTENCEGTWKEFSANMADSHPHKYDAMAAASLRRTMREVPLVL